MKKKFAWIGLGLLLAILATGLTAWFKRETIEHRLIDSYLKKIAPSLPFKINSYELSKNLDFLEVSLTWKDIDATFSGPLHFKWLRTEKLFQAVYEPELSIVGASPVHLLIDAEVPTHLKGVNHLKLNLLESDFEWKRFGVATKKLSFAGNFDGNTLSAQLNLKTLTYADPLHADHAVNLDTLTTQFSVPDFHHTDLMKLSVIGGGAEVLWGEFYGDFDLKAFPLDAETLTSNDATVKIGLHQEFSAQIKKTDLNTSVRFIAKPISLNSFAPWAIKTFSSIAPVLKSYTDYEFKAGTLGANGTVVITEKEDKNSFSVPEISLSGKKLSLQAKEKHLSIEGLQFEIPYLAHQKNHEVTLSADALHFRHFNAKLKKTKVEWNEDHFAVQESLPLEVNSIPLKIGPIHAALKPNFDLHSNLNLAPTELQNITNGFCVIPDHIPPSKFSIQFSDINVSPGVIDPTGKATIELFKGKMELNDIGLYELNTEVPETDFDVQWSGINLQDLGNWANFGEIKGTLEGYAHEVVLQSLLPTHYQFKVETLPLDQTKKSAHVEFSPEAMKNVVKVFTGSNIDEQIPGIAGWMMFGWPSHILGGYDVLYAGIKLDSEDGIISVETLDPPEVVEDQRKRFVIYGPRFKMPLRNITYPLLIDATSMSNFVHQLVGQLTTIKKQKERTSEYVEDEVVCDPPELK